MLARQFRLQREYDQGLLYLRLAVGSSIQRDEGGSFTVSGPKSFRVSGVPAEAIVVASGPLQELRVPIAFLWHDLDTGALEVSRVEVEYAW